VASAKEIKEDLEDISPHDEYQWKDALMG